MSTSEPDRGAPARRIVVGVDGSLSAQVALEHAVRRAAGGQVIVASVVSPVPDLIVRSLSDVDDAREDRAREVVEQLADEIEGEAEAVVLQGSPAAALADLARRREADEIVVGSRGLGRFAGALGSVSQALLAQADRPVVVVPRAAADRPSRTDSAQPRTLVVGYDGSEPARAELRYALQSAGAGRVVAVHAFQPAPDWLGAPNYQRALDRYQAHGRELLRALEDEHPAGGATLVTSLLEGPPARAIVAAADARDADEIVLGSRGFGPARGVLGSVSHAVVHEADRPVVVFPADALPHP